MPGVSTYTGDLSQSQDVSFTFRRTKVVAEPLACSFAPPAISTQLKNAVSLAPQLTDREWSLIWKQRRLVWAVEKQSVYGIRKSH